MSNVDQATRGRARRSAHGKITIGLSGATSARPPSRTAVPFRHAYPDIRIELARERLSGEQEEALHDGATDAAIMMFALISTRVGVSIVPASA
ncbi:hypothetical protein [Blastococcus sp. SYSU DS1024]